MPTTAAAQLPPERRRLLPEQLNPAELNAWLTFSALTVLQPIERWRLLERFGTLAEAQEADERALADAGVRPAAAAAAAQWRSTINPQGLQREIAAAGVKLCTILDADYPPQLTAIHDPPLVLFCRGALDNLPPAVAVVGTRQPSDYGLQVAHDVARQLAAAGVAVVSGLAYGIDASAHRGSLAASGRTVAVLGGGVDPPSVYPATHRALADRIVSQRGAIISEYPPQTPALPHHFLQRNRLIAGMTIATVVVEAPLHSGALVTARLAAEENREVFAVPGRITDENAAGVNRLIATGATPVQGAADVLAALHLSPPPAPAAASAEDQPAVAPLLAALAQPKTLDELRRVIGLPMGVVAGHLTLLEVRGLIRRLPNGKYHRSSTSW